MTRPHAAAFALGLLAVLLAPVAPARADTPSLQVAPLQYAGTLNAGKVSTGFVDVSNPTDASVNITSSVKKFRQTDSNGDLEFSDDPDLSAGIKVDLSNFTLGPREAVRVAFDVDSSKLPQGGVYAAIFFRTQPTNQTANSDASYVIQSANVGTLLILTNGGPGAHRGSIASLGLPFWQIGGGGLTGGGLTYKNTDTSKVAVAFDPKLGSAVLPWGRDTRFATGLVMPGITRSFSFSRPGSYFGLLPVTVTDLDSGHHATVWVFALTGLYRWLLPLLVVLAAVAAFILRTVKFKPRRIFKRRQPRHLQVPEPGSRPTQAPVTLDAPAEPAGPEDVPGAETPPVESPQVNIPVAGEDAAENLQPEPANEVHEVESTQIRLAPKDAPELRKSMHPRLRRKGRRLQ